MALKFYANVSQGLKLKVTNFWGLIPTFVEVKGEKLVGGSFCAFILNRVRDSLQKSPVHRCSVIKVYQETQMQLFSCEFCENFLIKKIFESKFAQSFIESSNLNSDDVLLNWKSYLYNIYVSILIMKYILSLYEIYSICENSHNHHEFFY